MQSLRSAAARASLRTLSTAPRSAVAQSSAARLDDHLESGLAAMREAGTYKKERVVTSAQGPTVCVAGRDGDVINLCSNNYLGLANDPAVVSAAQQALQTHGSGLASVRFICGTQELHKDLEDAITKFHGTEDTILYPSCFDANAGFFEALLTTEDAIISDALNHASIIDGIRLCKAERFRYKHLDAADLREKLQMSVCKRFKVVVTDGAFSMDGDVAPLGAIRKVCDEFGALLFVDECHATGFLGASGRGTPELFGVHADVINSTLGKALGGATGGYTTGSKAVVETLRNKSRPYLFSNALAPSAAAAALKVFEILDDPKVGAQLVERIRSNTHFFRNEMTKAGFTLSGHFDHPIAPVMLGDARLAVKMADSLLEKGVFVVGFSYPVVPHNTARIRCQISAAHSTEQLQAAVDAFVDVGREVGVIP